MYDQIKTQLDAISELGDEQLAELQADIISQFEAVEGEDPTPETVDAMTSLADSLDIVRGELSNREAMAAELATKAAEATARVKGAAEDEGEEMAMTEDEPMEEEVTEEEAPVEEASAEEAEETEEGDVEEDAQEDNEEEEMSADETIAASASEQESAEAVTEAVVETETIAEASAEVEVTEEVSTPEAELSTEEVAETPAQEAVAEAPVEAEAAVEETVVEAEAETEASIETEAEAEASVEIAAEAELSAEEVTEVVAEASTDQEDSSELSTASEEATELSTEETAEAVSEVVAEAELSAEENIESNTALVEEQKEQAVTAAAEQPFEAPADRQPVVQEAEAPVVAITAGADIPGYSAGSSIEMGDVATLMEKRLHSLRRVNGGDGEQHIVASFSTQYSEDRFLGTDAEANAAKIASEGQALVASGGHAAPAEVKYDIFGLGSTTNRPVRDSLPAFQADRGGVRFVTAPSFASGDYADAVGVWTAANDSAETPSPSAKTSLTVSAAAENVAVTDAVTLQLQFGNLMTRAYPELIARHNELALVQHAREAEVNLITKIGAASTAVTSGTILGFGRDFLVSVRKAAVAYRSRHRIAPTTQLKAIVPDWIFDAMASDLAIAMPGDNTIAVGRSEIEGYLAQSNVSLVASPDLNYYGAQGATALTEWKDSFVWYLFAEGTFLFLDGGTLDLGIIRDSSLVGTNDYKMFVETFEGIAKVGIESLAITQTVNVNGVAAALRDTTGGLTAAAIEL